MKRQNKKAFTLVELLVVIAILAILASVAVVGYTSFLKNAAISNDDSTVAQLNRYLEAMKADSKSEFYGEDIHAGNIAYKFLVHTTEFKNGCILTGTKAPAILTSRSDSMETKVNSIALAAVVAEAMKKKNS